MRMGSLILSLLSLSLSLALSRSRSLSLFFSRPFPPSLPPSLSQMCYRTSSSSICRPCEVLWQQAGCSRTAYPPALLWLPRYDGPSSLWVKPNSVTTLATTFCWGMVTPVAWLSGRTPAKRNKGGVANRHGTPAKPKGTLLGSQGISNDENQQEAKHVPVPFSSCSSQGELVLGSNPVLHRSNVMDMCQLASPRGVGR